MTEGTSKRARRAAQREQGEEPASQGASTDETAASAAPDGDPHEADGATEPAGVEGGSSKRAQRQAALSSGQIRDRNQRLRAEAAEKRRAKQAKNREQGTAAGLSAEERVDDALVRSTHAATQWLRKNFRSVQWLIIAGVVGGFGWQIYSWRAEKNRAERSDALIAGVDALNAQVGDSPMAVEDGFKGLRGKVESEQERLEKAAAAFQAAIDANGDSGPGWLARLELAGVRYQQKQFDEAIEGYLSVSSSPITKNDRALSGRVLEGLALSYEGKSDATNTLKTLEKLSETPGFEATAAYHQGRLAMQEGQLDEAKKHLGTAQKHLESQETSYEGHRPSYLETAVKDLLRSINPAGMASARTGAELDGLTRSISNDPEQLKAALQRIVNETKSEQPPTPASDAEQGPSGAPPAAPTPAAPAPAAPAPAAPTPAAPTPAAPAPAAPAAPAREPSSAAPDAPASAPAPAPSTPPTP